MPSIPLPFLVGLCLLVLLAVVARRDGEAKPNGPFLLLIVGCAVQAFLIGLRWGYGLEQLRYVLPVLAAVQPPLVYLSFERLVELRSGAGVWLHAVPAALVAVLILAFPPLVDAALVAIYLGYAAGLLLVARRGPDALRAARFEGVVPAYRALQLAVAALIFSTLIDVLVFLDLERMQGAHAGEIVGFANLLGLLALGVAVTVAGRAQPPNEMTIVAAGTAVVEEPDEAVMAAIEALMGAKRLYRDPDLNLTRLARRAGFPVRDISMAINRLKGCNVSQYINGYRIEDACRRLAETDDPVTGIMFDCGFQTKSNFHREFRRVTGVNPSAWRAQKRPPQ
jgi:AraC-like DNA-binding protein